MSGNTVTLHRVIKAKPERVYRAFLDRWKPSISIKSMKNKKNMF